MPEPRTARPRRRATPRHGRPPRRGGLLTRRFGPLSLVLAAGLGASAGMGVGSAVVPTVTVPDSALAAVTEGGDAAPRATEVPRSPVPDAPVDDRGLTPSGRVLPDVPDGLRIPSAPPVPEPLVAADPDAPDADGLTPQDRAAGLLSAEVPAAADGSLTVVPGTADAPDPTLPVRTVRVEVEAGLAVDPEAFAGTVMEILNDPRGWGADGSVSFARTDGDADLSVVLASPALTDEMCAPLETVGLYSCAAYGHAVLNHMRWVDATDEFEDRTQYRRYLVNHEVGHLLGHGHVTCPAEGAVAPVMQQQTVEVAPCVPNGWPFPDAG